MQAVVLVNAAPSFEESVVAALLKMQGVKGLARVKRGNFDIAVLLDVRDESDVQTFVTSRLRLITGVQGVERLESPSAELVARLATPKR